MGQNNKWDRRDNKRNARRRMRVSGVGTRVLQRIILEKAGVIKSAQATSA